jgi:hypothetical protein
MKRPVPLILGLALGSVQADFSVSAKANVITPDHRPTEGCAVAMTGSKEPPRESFWWTVFRGHFTKRQTTSSDQPMYVHVRCQGWRPVVRTLFYRSGRGWSGDSVTFILGPKPVDLGTITLQPR